MNIKDFLRFIEELYTFKFDFKALGDPTLNG